MKPVDEEDLERIRQEASPVQDESPTQRLARERKEKHSKSVAMVEKWGDSLLRQREKRLAAQEERKRAIEDEREKLSAEWKMLKNDERQDAVKRARRLQQAASARHRKLDSVALVSAVLEERKLQIQYKDMTQQRESALQHDEDARDAHRRDKEDERLAKKKETERRNRIQDALQQRDRAKAEKDEEQKRRALSSKGYSDQLRRIEEGIVAQKRRLLSAKADQIQTYKASLLECIRKKRELQAGEEAMARKRSARDKELRNTHEKKNAQRLRVRESADRRRQGAIDAVAEKQQELAVVQEGARREFLTKFEGYIQSSPSGALDQDTRAKKIQAQNNVALVEINAYQKQRTALLQEAKAKQTAEDTAERRMLEMRATSYMEGERRKKASARKKAKNIGEVRLSQVNEKQTIASEIRKAEEDLESRIQKEYDEADRALEAYAKELIATCSPAGSTLRIPNVLVGHKPVDRWASKRLDTFRRLGFVEPKPSTA